MIEWLVIKDKIHMNVELQKPKKKMGLEKNWMIEFF